MLRNLCRLNSQLNVLNKRHYAKAVNMLGRRNVDTSKDPEVTTPAPVTSIAEKLENVSAVSGVPDEYIKERVARIYVPAKNSMQSGTHGTKKWKIEFDGRERWENATMGWGSTGDPLSNLNLEFTNKEDAVLYCERMGYKYSVEEKNEINLRPKSYGGNFSWNKRTRVHHK